QTATNTIGATTVSLRGLGANRNLVLINGRRAMPVNPAMTVDTNSIPSTAIQRVEVISGGASAVYGGDDRGNAMLGIERSTRSKQLQYERDWRIEDYANPNTTGGFFAFGSASWFH